MPKQINAQMPSPTSEYRADVDGLRALAVILVLCYHAKLGFPGGFLGVDVFFVISGFLITGIILRKIQSDTFSMREFWMRRIRRILPASLAMVIATIVAGCIVLLPNDFVELSHSALAYLAMGANFFFYRNTGYFDGNVELKPLLHMWSLAVEEQFYLFYPIYLTLLPPNTRLRRFAFLLLLLACLALGCYGHIYHRSAAFYLLPCRAWELLLGGAIHLLPARLVLSKLASNVLGAIGLCAILASSWISPENWHRHLPPGLIPCLGTALVISAGNQQACLASRVLRLRPLVFIGLISYSLYLWHWPILSYLKHFEMDLLFNFGSWHYRLLALLITFPVATLSWKYIEQPFRLNNATFSNRKCLTTILVAASVAAGVSLFAMKFQGFPGRFDPRVLNYANARGDNTGKFGRTMDAKMIRDGDLLAFGSHNAKKKILFFGDSQAMTLLKALEPRAAGLDLRVDQATRFATAPLLDFDHLASWQNEGGSAFCEEVYRHLEKEHYDAVVFVASWESYVGAKTFPHALRKSLEQLKKVGTKVYFILPHPDQGINIPAVLSSSVRLGKPVQHIGVPLSKREERIHQLRQLLSDYQSPTLTVIDPISALTDEHGIIRAEMDGKSLYSDHFHLSSEGASRVADTVLPKILESLDSY